jgi:type II secretory pathway pseudopilin PulG
MRIATKGFTIIEVIVVTFITSMAIIVLVRFVGVGFPLSKVSLIQASSTETARLQLHRLATALRELRYSDDGAYPIEEASPQRLIFYANIDTDIAVERVRYELVGTNVVRGVTKPSGTPLAYNPAQEVTTTVARYIRNGAIALFTYYTGNYPTDTTVLTNSDVLKITYIDFNLLLDVDPAVAPPAIPIHSQVQLRNLKTNLGS